MKDFFDSIENMDLADKAYVDLSIGIADKIFKRMDELKMTQRDLANKMGKSEAEISKILSGEQNFTLRTICKYEIALNFKIIAICQ